MRGKPRNWTILCRSPLPKYLTTDLLSDFFEEVDDILSGLQSTNERQAKQSTNHVQELRTLPPKYQTAYVLSDLFEEGDGHLGAVVSGVLQQ